MGLILPNKGKIYVDKYLVNNVLEDYQKIIGYVPQDIYLMDDTVLNNITFLDKSKLNKSFINEIIKKSKLETTIKKLPNGIRTIIGERGSKISAGQKQRLAIARALYRKPKILVMDEPTSSLDKINENMIINNITKIKNLTVIVITHNQQILKKFDRVFFLGKNNSFKIIKKNR
jgi:ABC-type bacteriocin/lantibiotic exporter with double-glycine peptidase domain